MVGELYVEYEYWFAAVQLSLAMLGMGATLRLPDFGEVLREPRGVVVGLFTQLVCVPLIALGTTQLLPLHPGIAVGLVLVAAVPGGTISNVLTFLARGNTPLSISLTAVSTVACLVTTPVVIELLAGRHVPEGFAMPVARVSREILFTLLGPLALGMLLGARRERWRGPVSRWGIRGSLFVIGLMVLGGAAAGRIEPLAYGWTAPLAVLALSALGLNAGMLLCRAAGLPRGDRVAVGIEAGVRNTNLALLIKASVFPASSGPDPIGDGAFFVALLYGAVALPVAVGPILVHRRRGAPRPPERAGAPAGPGS